MGRKILSLFLTMAFVTNAVVPSYAQGVALGKGMGSLPEPGVMVGLSNPVSLPVFKGVRVDANDPLKFEFILDPGDKVREARSVGKEDAAMKAELEVASQRLTNYFLTTLTVPDEDIWVNLSPYEKDRITPEKLGQTEMGRDLLAQDYLLKQITATLLYPEGESGRKFWARVYEEAQKKLGTTDIPVDTFNKVWIMPDKAEVYEKVDNGKAVVFVVNSSLKVMLESDFLAMSQQTGPESETQQLGKAIAREIIIPLLQKEVNEGANFAPLRQVYASIILGLWYKEKLKDSILSSVYVDRNKVAGIDIADKEVTRKIWAQYVEAFNKGAVNYVREETDPVSGETIPRKYLAGGFSIERRSFIKKMGLGVLAAAALSELSLLTVACDNEELEYIKLKISPEETDLLNANLEKYANASNDVEKTLFALSKKMEEVVNDGWPAFVSPNNLVHEWRALNELVRKLNDVEFPYTDWRMDMKKGSDAVRLLRDDLGVGSETVRIEVVLPGAEPGYLYPIYVINVKGKGLYVLPGHSYLPKYANLAARLYPEYSGIEGWTPGDIYKNITEKVLDEKSPIIWWTPAAFYVAFDMINKGPLEMQGKVLYVPLAKLGEGQDSFPYKGLTIKEMPQEDYAQQEADDQGVLRLLRDSIPTGKVLALNAMLLISSQWYGCEKYEPKKPSYYMEWFTGLSKDQQDKLTYDITNYANSEGLEKTLYDLANALQGAIEKYGGDMTRSNVQQSYLKWNSIQMLVDRLKDLEEDYSDWDSEARSVFMYNENVDGAGLRTVGIDIILGDGQWVRFYIFNTNDGRGFVVPQDDNYAELFYSQYAKIWPAASLRHDVTDKILSYMGLSALYTPFHLTPGDMYASLAYAGYATVADARTACANGGKIALFGYPVADPEIQPDLVIPEEFTYDGVTFSKMESGVYKVGPGGEGAQAAVHSGSKTVENAQKTSLSSSGAEIVGLQRQEGGIDLKRSSMPLEKRSQGGDVKFNIDPAMLRDLDGVSGFRARILEMAPLPSLLLFLGMDKVEGSVQGAS